MKAIAARIHWTPIEFIPRATDGDESTRQWINAAIAKLISCRDEIETAAATMSAEDAATIVLNLLTTEIGIRQAIRDFWYAPRRDLASIHREHQRCLQTARLAGFVAGAESALMIGD